MDTRRRICILAPHLSTPIRNGSDLYIWSKWGALDCSEWDTTLVGGDGIYQLDAGRWSCRHPSPGTARHRAAIAGRMLFHGDDYLSAKLNSAPYAALCRTLKWETFDSVVVSYMSTWKLAKAMGVTASQVILETHNFDPKLYLDRALEQSGLKRHIALVAAGRAHAIVKGLPVDAPALVLGGADRHLYEGSGFRHVIESSFGHEPKEARAVFPSNETVRISFLGALSAAMNDVALRNFVQVHLPELRKRSSLPIRLIAIGSRPPADLRRFLAQHEVELVADATDTRLAAELQACHATILPFDSTNGLKLKFGSAASLGVPILSFIDPPKSLGALPGLLRSRSMAAWATYLRRLATEPGFQSDAAWSLQAAAARHSWSDVMARDMQAIAAVRTQFGRPADSIMAPSEQPVIGGARTVRGVQA